MRKTSPRGPVLQRAARAILGAPVRRLWPCARSGFDTVPQDGPVVLCANHLSFFDSVLMTMTLDRPVYFIGKSEYLDSWKTRRLLPALGMIPIDRDNAGRAMLTLDAAAEVLRSGAALCVFPEGTRSRDGHLHRGYVGAARLAIAVGCPILPVGIVGTDAIQPPGARLPRLRQACSVSIGSPVVATGVDLGSRRASRAVTDELMGHIAALSGQRYIAAYSSRTRPVTAVEKPSRKPRDRPRIGMMLPAPAATASRGSLVQRSPRSVGSSRSSLRTMASQKPRNPLPSL